MLVNLVAWQLFRCIRVVAHHTPLDGVRAEGGGCIAPHKLSSMYKAPVCTAAMLPANHMHDVH
jgi:hypothetical protein